MVYSKFLPMMSYVHGVSTYVYSWFLLMDFADGHDPLYLSKLLIKYLHHFFLFMEV